MEMKQVAAVTTWTPDRPTKPGNVPINNLGWTKVTERLPPYQENIRVLIYTEGVEFNGVQFFDVPADSLYGDAVDLEEAQRHATHWMLLTDLRLPYVEPPDPFAEPVPKPVEKLPSDAELVKSAIRLMRTPRRKYSRTGSQRPLWSRVMLLFGHGSTYSRAICRAHGFDPDEVWMIEEASQ